MVFNSGVQVRASNDGAAAYVLPIDSRVPLAAERCGGVTIPNYRQLHDFESHSDADFSGGLVSSTWDSGSYPFGSWGDVKRSTIGNIAPVAATANESMADADSLKERLEFYQSRDEIVTRSQLAGALGIAPNRVSELVGMGVLEEVSRNPLRFALEHSKACYLDYQWWLKFRRRGERYAASGSSE
jgi:hypothetical protein